MENIKVKIGCFVTWLPVININKANKDNIIRLSKSKGPRFIKPNYK